MSIGAIKHEGDLKRWLRRELQTPDILPPTPSSLLHLAQGGDRKVDFGTTTLKFSASKFPGEKSVAHGLGTIPAVVVATPANNVVTVSTFGYTETSFTLWGGNWFEALTGEVTVHWIAIG